jgi:hypothetical protein
MYYHYNTGMWKPNDRPDAVAAPACIPPPPSMVNANAAAILTNFSVLNPQTAMSQQQNSTRIAANICCHMEIVLSQYTK